MPQPAPDLSADQLKLHDLAVRDWLLGLKQFLPGQDFNVVFATPDRAFATLREILALKYGDRADKIRTAPFPLASIARLSHNFDMTRFVNSMNTLRSRVYTSDKRIAYEAYFPAPWNLTYQVDFWARNRETLNVFLMWAAAGLTPQSTLTVDYSPVWAPWGKKIVFFESEELTDNSVLESEEENRALRYTLTATLKGWVLFEPKACKTIHDVLVQAYDALGATVPQLDADPTKYPLLDRVRVDPTGIV